MPVARKPRTMLERVRVRIRKMRSGMIGFARRDSRTTNATRSTTAPPTKPSVWTDSHPEPAAVVIP